MDLAERCCILQKSSESVVDSPRPAGWEKGVSWAGGGGCIIRMRASAERKMWERVRGEDDARRFFFLDVVSFVSRVRVSEQAWM